MSSTPMNCINLKIVAININSIVSNHKRFELLEFTNKFSHDIILISETKLNVKHKLEFELFNLIRTDRPGSAQGGGTTILINWKLKYDVINYPSSSKNEIIEFTIIKLPTVKKTNLFIVSIYARKDDRKLFIKKLNSLFDKLHLHHPDNMYIIAGDLNARRTDWGDRISNARGRLLSIWEATDALSSKRTYSLRIYLRILQLNRSWIFVLLTPELKYLTLTIK